jgi:RimJ/RimL family protein N-acetyltransferase
MDSTEKDKYILRRLLPAQWADYKSIRLEALQTNPEMFGSNYAREAAYIDSDWISFLENESRAIFGLYHDKSLVGLSAVTIDKNDETSAVLYASFIRLAHRGKGLSKLFYEARIEWARQKGCKSIVVSHRSGNLSSKAANQKFGFQYTHTEEVSWPDGQRADEVMYVLKLDD